MRIDSATDDTIRVSLTVAIRFTDASGGVIIFDTHTAGPLQANMLIGSMNVVKCYTCEISGSYAHLDCIISTLWVILVIGIACRSLIL